MTTCCCYSTIQGRSIFCAKLSNTLVAMWMFLLFVYPIAYLIDGIVTKENNVTDTNCTSINIVTASRRNVSDYTINCTDNDGSWNSSANCNSTTINDCKSNENKDGLTLFQILLIILYSPIIVLLPYICLLCATRCFKPIYHMSERLRTRCNKPLGTLLNELHISIAETMDRECVEIHAKQYLDKLFEALNQHNNFDDGMDILLAGSVAECFSLPFYPGNVWDYKHANISDFDFMISSKTESASFEENTDVKYKVVYGEEFLDTGFVYLFDNETSERVSGILLTEHFRRTALKMKVRDFQYKKSCLRHLSEICYLSCLRNNTIQIKTNGPAITIQSPSLSSFDYYFDITFSVHCSEWPHMISDWKQRSKEWPDARHVERIMNYGCFLVPKSQGKTDRQNLTWRISFSKSELELAKLMPPVAKMCFMGIKALRQDRFAKFPQGISSYCFKSIFLYTLEKTDPKIWSTRSEENISKCFYILLDEVAKAFGNKLCRHFWIPGIDLFKDYSSRTLEEALKVLKKVQRRPNLYIEPFPIGYLKRFPKVANNNDIDGYALV